MFAVGVQLGQGSLRPITAGCANAVAVLGGLLLAVLDWARLSIRASVLPVVSRTVLMPDLQQCLQAGALSRADIARRQMTEGSYDDGGGEGARTALRKA